MRKITLALVVMALSSLGQVGVSHAFNNIFLHIAGIKGESRASGRTDWIELTSISWGHGQPAPGTATGLKLVFDPIAFTKHVDSTSPDFALLAASGQPYPQMVVEFVKPAAPHIVFARLELTNVRLVQYRAGASTLGDGIPIESVAISFATIKWTMERFDPTGHPISPRGQAGWDLLRNKSLF